MLTIFNRREVQMFTSLKRCEQAAETLEQHNIEVSIRVRDRFSPSILGAGTRERTGTAFQNRDVQYQYTLYVHRRDYDTAMDLLRLVHR